MWEFVLAGLDGTSLGEIQNAHDRNVGLPLSRTPTASFRLSVNHPLIPDLADGDVLVKVYDHNSAGKQLRVLGEVASIEEQGTEDGGSMAITVAGGFSRLFDRLVGKSTTGYTNGTAGSQVDKGQIAADMITRVNAAVGANTDAGGDTGIRVGSVSPSANGYAGPWFYKPVAEGIVELATTLDGFEWEVDPVEPVRDAQGLKIGTFNAGPFLGTNRPDIFFEFGNDTKRNVASYRRLVDRQGLLNFGYSLPQGFPENSTGAVMSSSSAASIALRGRHEGVVATDLVVDQLRQQLVQEHVSVRAVPREVFTFDPSVQDEYEFGVDYDIGDIVHGRAEVAGKTRIDGLVRIYGVSIAVDDQGHGAPSLQLVPEGSGGA